MWWQISPKVLGLSIVAEECTQLLVLTCLFLILHLYKLVRLSRVVLALDLVSIISAASWISGVGSSSTSKQNDVPSILQSIISMFYFLYTCYIKFSIPHPPHPRHQRWPGHPPETSQYSAIGLMHSVVILNPKGYWTHDQSAYFTISWQGPLSLEGLSQVYPQAA